ncbi:type VI secretion system tip protein TssI/VgrG [Escherichia coli]|uniref:type VI secretion system tip protein TssI/VgrG n=1 Tax=Escherichia coli TaxID=562 RepID=UPI000F54A87D|nr:type VI secretion system tip protein TssI/VgrG [Escherichia coli]MCK2471749.1 type VI secretion system tip protein VgrG [Escherichia coli]MCK2504620.1 type VI secretion system tip protein VgrG [Escherichia coli]WCP60583.1 type VI secretion system tip protein TssI/VgrG [Escherichia coli]HAH1198187.1 type VI secretion system tip protein VgrG [Escherichia coli]HAJ3998627.1 type VI secretion system tip protein VgrG [Escherichia coli]
MSTGLRFTLEVDGLPPDAFAVVSFHLNQLLSSLFSLDLSLVSQQFLSLEFAQVLDKMAYLTIWQGDEVQRRVKGVVTWFELGENDKNQMLYSMKVCPPLWRTGLRQNFRIFQNEDIESILATILKENGVTEWSPLFSEPHPSREFCVQYGETDYDFLCRMAAEEGIFFYEEHAQKSTDQSLVLCDTVRYLPESFEIPWNPNTRTEVSTLCISQFRYRYSGTGRLTGVHTTAANLDIDIPYATDPAGNRLPDPELHPDSTLTAWPDNRIAEDAHYVYRYDEYGRLAEKTDRIPEGVIRMHDERTHHYHYDSQHRLVFYTRIQHGEPQVESRYLYDPLGRRTGKRVWRRERDLTGWMSLSRKPEETWYGWDGDRLTTVQTQQTRIQTVYQPGSFTPLLRIETENGEQAKARHRSLAEVLQEDTGVTLPAELAVMLGRLERELRQGSVSEESQQWLAQCGLTAEQMAAQLEAEYIPERKLHLYHCDHRGLPLALISPEGETAWQGEYDEWGNLLGEESAQHLQQSLRLPGQQYDEESGLYYNRNRYYDPLQGRYITQDPIGLRGEWNLYKYPLNPVRFIDSLGLKFHVNGDPSDFNQAVEYLKQDSQMKETIDFLSSSEETINIEYIEGTNVRFNSNNMAIYWNSRASLFCSTELNSKSQSPALGLGHEFAHAQYYLLDKENFMALLSRTDKKYENKEEARVITIIESRAAKTLGECTRGAHSGLPFYRVDGPLQTMKITGTPE